MAQIEHFYGHFTDKCLNGEIKFLADTVNVMLLDSGYIPDKSAHFYKSDVVAHEITGTNYSAGGQSLASKALMYYSSDTYNIVNISTAYSLGDVRQTPDGIILKCTVAGTSSGTPPTYNSILYGTTTDGTAQWTTVGMTIPQWQPNSSYAINDIIRPGAVNGHTYRCVGAGISGSLPPLWPQASGTTVPDSGVIWQEVGFGYLRWSANNIVWSNATIIASYAVVYDATPATDATRPLIGFIDFGGSTSATNGTFTIQWDSHGVFLQFLS